MTFLPPKDATKEKAKPKGDDQPKPIEFKEDSPNWAYAFYALQVLPRQAVQLTVNHANTADHDHARSPTRTGIYPLRGLQFQALIHTLPPQPAGVALKRGSTTRSTTS